MRRTRFRGSTDVKQHDHVRGVPSPNGARRPAPRRTRHHFLSVEDLEGRMLLDMAIGEIVGNFDSGINAIRSNTTGIVRSWDRDITDIPLLQQQPIEGLRIDDTLGRILPKAVGMADSIDAVRADLVARGIEVLYLGTTPDAAGNYLVARQPVRADDIDRQITVGGDEGFDYLNRAVGSLTGSVGGKVSRLVGALSYVVNDGGFHIRSGESSLSGRFDLSGRAEGRQDIGVLKGVQIGGSLTFIGTFGLRFRDDGDGMLTPGQLVTDASVLGTLDGRVSYRPRFSSSIGNLTPISWTGDFTSLIDGGQASGDENFNLPSYRAIADKIGAGLVVDLRSQEWFKQIDGYLNKKIPVVDKTVEDFIGLKGKAGGFLAALGVTVLNEVEGQRAMMRVIKGEVVDLASINVGGSKSLWGEKDIIPPIPLYYSTIVPGLLDAKVVAFLKANLGFNYRVSAGVDTRGVFFGKDMSLGLTGGLSGGIEGSLRTLDLDWLKASGSVSLDVELNVNLFDRDNDGKIYATEVNWGSGSSLVTTLDVDLNGKVKGSLEGPEIDIGFFDSKPSWTFFSESFKIADVINVSFGPQGRPPVENTRPQITDTLPTEPDRPPPAANPPAAPADLRARSISARAVELSWEDRSADEVAFRVAISRDGGATWDHVGATPANKSSLRVAGLDPNTSYLFKVRAVNGRGNSAYSKVIDLRTTIGIPQPPANLRAASVGARTVDLNWDDRSGDEEGFEIIMSTNGGASWQGVKRVGPNVTSLQVAELTPSTNYLFAVQAYGSEGGSEWVHLSVATTNGIPAAPANLRVANVWARTVDLNWDDRSNNEAGFEVIAIGGDLPAWHYMGSSPADKASFRVEGLKPGTTYRFQVKAVNAAGASEWSNIFEVTTRIEAPAAPANLRVANVWARTVDLNWDDRSSNEAEFRVAISRDGGVTWDNVGVVGANVTAFRIEGLKPSTRYLFRVRAANAEGYSDYSNTIDVRTRS